jgi:VCBS repeat-containing protein
MATQKSNTPSNGAAVAVANTPQAKDDYASDFNNAGIYINVLSNDLGGAARSLYSIDQSDPLTVETVAYSALGATIKIINGQIYYDPTTDPAFASLAAGQTVTDSFTYAIRLGNGTISTATAYVTVTGTNFAPVAVADTASVKEDTNTPAQPNPVSGNVLTNDTDANASDTHSVTAVNGQAANVGTDVAGSYGMLHLNADGSYTYTLDNSNASVQALAEGQKAFDVFTYTNSDNHGASSSTTLTITVNGTDDAPTVSAGLSSAALVEQGTSVAGVATSTVNIAIGDVDGTAAYDTAGWTKLTDTTFWHDGTYGSAILDTAANTLTYTLDNARQATDSLTQDQQASDSFNINVTESDGSLTASTPVSFSITGSDDAPTVSANNPSAILAEQGVNAPGIATSVVNLNIGDVDGAASYDTTGAIALTATTFRFDGTYGFAVLDTVANTLTYTLDDTRPATDALSQDQQVSDAFNLVVKESDGSLTASLPVSFTIIGSNDAPTITGGQISGNVTEDEPQSTSGPPSGLDATLTADGTISFIDPDSSDEHHIVTITADGSNYLGAMQADITHETLHSGSSSSDEIGIVSWGYSVLNADLQFLSQGQEIDQSYTITVADDHGATATQDVTVRLFGNNDAPTVTADTSTGMLDETLGIPTPGAQLSTTGGFTFSDVDLLDTHTVGTPIFINLGTGSTPQIGQLSASLNPDGTSVSWTYTVNADAVEYLSQGQQLVESFLVPITDNWGSTVDKLVQVTVNGSDDAPTIIAGPPSATLIEQGTNVAGVATSVVNLTIGDVDGTASYDTSGWTELTATTFMMDATYGYAVLDTAANTLTYTLDNTRPATDALTQDQHVSDSFTVNVQESDGSLTASAPVTFSITGSDDVVNSAPVLSDFSSVSYLGTQAVVATNSATHGRVAPDEQHVLFWSYATDLVPGATNGAEQIYLKDIATGEVALVSANASGTEGNASVWFPDNSSQEQFSPDGTKIIFSSDANNLVPSDANGTYDTFIKDMTTGTVTLISTDANGVHGNGASYGGVFSPDGSKVAFYSQATNLVPGGTAGIYVKDLATGAIHEVASGGDSVDIPVFSPDGTELVYDDGNQSYLVNLTTDTRSVISTNANGVAGNGFSMLPVFSPDGTEVAFGSNSTNLVPGATNGTIQSYLKDLTTGAVTLISADANGVEGNGSYNWPPYFSPDGNKVGFESGSSNLVPGTPGGAYVKNLDTGHVTYVGAGADPAFSPDGSQLVYGNGSQLFLVPVLNASGAVVDNTLLTMLTTQDTFNFSDINLSDTHTVSVAAQQGDLGTLTASVSHDTTGTGTGGIVTWDYQVSEAAVHSLASPATDIFTVTVDDGHSGLASVNLQIALLQHDVLL